MLAFSELIGDGPTGALFDPTRIYRYTLWRRFDETPCGPERFCAFVGLNPSTADESKNDPTVTRCINFAKSWGYGGMIMLNLFAYRATDPAEMKRHSSPVGPMNDEVLGLIARQAGKVVCCWGVHGDHRNRCWQVRFVLAPFRPQHLGMTKHGQPKHPLYLKQTTQPVAWSSV